MESSKSADDSPDTPDPVNMPPQEGPVSHPSIHPEIDTSDLYQFPTPPPSASVKLKSPASDTAEKDGDSHSKDEHVLLQILFGCTLEYASSLRVQTLQPSLVIDTPSLYHSNTLIFLKDLGRELSGTATEGSGAAPAPSSPQLKRSDVASILSYAIAFFIRGGGGGSCSFWDYLSDCYHRCSPDYNFPIGLLRLAKKVQLDMPACRDIIITHGALLFQCLDYFSAFLPNAAVISLPPDYVHRSFLETLAASHSNPQFFIRVLEETREPDPADFTAAINGLCAAFASLLKGRSIADSRSRYLWAMRALVADKAIAEAITNSPCFLNFQLPPPPNAWRLQLDTTLGVCLQVTPLDQPFAIQEGFQSTRERHFDPLFVGSGVTRQSSFLQTLMSLRSEVETSNDTIANLVLTICKAGAGPRMAVLRWFAAILEGNTKRQKTTVMQLFQVLNTHFPPHFEKPHLELEKLSCDGFNLNVFWILLKLLEPVKVNKVCDIDPFYCLREEGKQLLGDYATEPCLDPDRRPEALECLHSQQSAGSGAAQVKFPTQILWLTFRALRVLFAPFCQLSTAIMHHVNGRELNPPATDLSPEAEAGRKQKKLLLAKILCVNCVIHHQSFRALFWHFHKLATAFIARLATIFDRTGGIRDAEADEAFKKPDPDIAKILKRIGTDELDLSVQASCLPVCLLEGLMEPVKLYASLMTNHRDLMEVSIGDCTSQMDPHSVASYCLLLMRSPRVVPSPHCRWSGAAEPLCVLYAHPRVGLLLDSNPDLVHWFTPCIAFGFLDAHKADYYGRINRRNIYIQQLGRALALTDHACRLKEYAEAEEETFTRFLAMLVDSLTWLLEEGMSHLAEVKAREAKQTPDPQPSRQLHNAPTADQPAAGTEDVEEDQYDTREPEEGRSVTDIPMAQLESLTTSLMSGGTRALTAMSQICRLCGDMIVSNPLLLEQTVTSLDCCLDKLVGPRCLQLKVSSFEKYHFDPRQLLASLCEIYCLLDVADKGDGRLVTAICNEGRFFKPAVFSKAMKVTRREALLKAPDFERFANLTMRLQEKATEHEKEEQWLAEIWEKIPDEFKDPIMDELMVDPVQLPSSGNVMDRKHIERHLMTEEFDPFNRNPLSKDQLIPQDELRNRIQQFLNDQRAKRVDPSLSS